MENDVGATFKQLATAAMRRANDRLLLMRSDHERIKIMEEMIEELRALRDSWEAISGERVEIPTFQIVMEFKN